MSRTTYASALRRLKDEQGFMAGSIQEMLVALPILLIVVLAALGFAVTSQRTEARSQARYNNIEQTQRSLNKMVRELRQASKITYGNPSWSSLAGTGKTNSIVAHTVSSTIGGAPRDISYGCLHTITWAGQGPWDSFCLASYKDDSGATRIDWYVPATGEYPSWLSFQPGAGARVPNSSGTASTVATADIDNFAIFRFERNGQLVTDPAQATTLTIRMVVCAKTQTCSEPGMRQPVVLQASVAPRNAATGFGN